MARIAMTEETENFIEAALEEVRMELLAAYENFKDFRSAHEGVAIIEEEFLELREAAYWPHKDDTADEETEAKQLAAMAIRYLVDVCMSESPR